MTMHHDHVTEVEDAAFDKTLKVIGAITALIVVACMALWYFAS
jgi:hypothetical protein